MKRKIIFVIGMMLLVSSQNADAACVSTDKSYTACKSGYYLTKTPEFISQTTTGTCLSCPESGQARIKTQPVSQNVALHILLIGGGENRL